MMRSLSFLVVMLSLGFPAVAWSQEAIDFNRDVRPILSNNCFQCHGPDAAERKGGIDGLRLDTREGALADLGGHAAIVPGKPEKSELIRRVTSQKPGEMMPPRRTGKKLSAREIEILTRWIKEGARYAPHWAYVKPARPALPVVRDRNWPRNPIDHFILARLEKEGLKPLPEAERRLLARRVALDLTGLPPTLAEVEKFVADKSPNAYEKFVEEMLKKPAFGEHWARMWLDLARYADSAGYADDPLRVIWAYRDYVIRSFNANKPLDQFTIEQLAGDLLANPTDEQLIATAFHRNTLTNNEGGTSDEEFRNVAVVDRVNTTMTVWMGTSMACAQCHTHKYDPISQEEYFRFFAFFNNTADADRPDESPRHPVYTEEQKARKARWEAEIAALEKKLQTPTPQLLTELARWEKEFTLNLNWQTIKPESARSRNGTTFSIQEDDSVLVTRGSRTDVYTVDLPLPAGKKVTALRLEALPHDSLPSKGPGRAAGNFILTRVTANLSITGAKGLSGRYLRVELPGKQRILSLAEVQAFSGPDNVARQGKARQSSTAFEGPAHLAIDGNTNGDYTAARSTTHTAQSDDPWWEVDLRATRNLDRIVLWNRTDNGLHTRLAGCRVLLLDEKRKPVWQKDIPTPPNPSLALDLGGPRLISFLAAHAEHSQAGFDAGSVLDSTGRGKGWAIAPQVGRAHALTLIPDAPLDIPAGARLLVNLEQLSRTPDHTLGRFRLSVTADARAERYARTPAGIVEILKIPAEKRTAAQKETLLRHFLSVAPSLAAERQKLAGLRKSLAELKPVTTVPIMQELRGNARRKTRIQYRGNYLDVGPVVTEGVPTAFHPLPRGAELNRLTLAKWLMDENNPLTARVMANRFWEQIFGLGLVKSSEEFGSQGDLPSHPELLDWLATEFIRLKWDVKAFLKLLVTSAAYRQSSRVTAELLEKDPDNRLLSRGPRHRLSAEVIRDQALAIGGLLSTRMYGPSVRPIRPVEGLSAAFGSSIDWRTSEGEDRYRRGLYTEWRRTNPYPSMVTFDAPSRESCTIRRARTNTPLQALTLLNDPVYVEAAQGLARRMLEAGKTPAERARLGFRLCLIRQPGEREVQRLVQLYNESREDFARKPERAKMFAGTLPQGVDAVEMAAWTLVANVLLNLDETLMRP